MSGTSSATRSAVPPAHRRIHPPETDGSSAALMSHVPHLRVHLSLTRPVVAPGAAALPASQQGISQLGSVAGSLHGQHQPG